MPSTHLIKVDARNRCVGTGEKLSVHLAGERHRAFSIFLVDGDGRLLLQQRHAGKYHSGGLWANACCGHPMVGERTIAAASRRLREELNIGAQLRFGFFSSYVADVGGGLVENEFVYVFFGRHEGEVDPNPVEVMNTRRVSLAEIRQELALAPNDHAAWVRHYFAHHGDQIEELVARTRRATAPAA